MPNELPKLKKASQILFRVAHNPHCIFFLIEHFKFFMFQGDIGAPVVNEKAELIGILNTIYNSSNHHSIYTRLDSFEIYLRLLISVTSKKIQKFTPLI